MGTQARRYFLKSITGGIAGSMIIPELLMGELKNLDKVNHLNRKMDDSEDSWQLVKEQFVFAPGIRYFNNASLGSCPNHVRKATNAFRDTLDSFPSKYMWGGWKDEIENVRNSVASLLKVSAEEIALIHNTTEGMNLIARSMDLQPGDEVILADHEHTSGTIPWEVWQETKGIKIVRPELPILPESEDDLVACYEKAITSKTKVISMCHIVNTNGMILPVRAISKMAHEREILVAVDGAQSAGMFDIDLHDLGCDFYTASAHKWMFSPKGVGVFYARKDSQHHLKPLIVCRGHRDTSIRRLENYNTRNLPEVLGLGAAVEYYYNIGPQTIHNRTYELKQYFRGKINGNPKFTLKTPGADHLSGAIQVVELLDKNVRTVKNQLADNYGIDCRPMSTFNLNALRISLAIYITKADIDYLVNALEEIADS
ncbi:MAG: aminotransferase class V-fold PLP-dependent enzyme [Saprospiraceae bacterium]|nr:aminotransferase class V-fold PLP-dependent enzyme [Saprospiraceae bacterium]